jgi:hypothetical protein
LPEAGKTTEQVDSGVASVRGGLSGKWGLGLGQSPFDCGQGSRLIDSELSGDERHQPATERHHHLSQGLGDAFGVLDVMDISQCRSPTLRIVRAGIGIQGLVPLR